MKRTLSIILVLFILAGFCALSFAEEAAGEKEIFTSGSFDYTIENNEATIVKYTGEEASLQIPDEIDGYPVTAIGDNAFYLCENLISVTIPDSVTSIGNNAFDHCLNMASVTIPDSVVFIGDFAFADCDRLTSITIPDSVTNIGANPFIFCDRLIDIIVSQNHPAFEIVDSVLYRKTDKTLIVYPWALKNTEFIIPYGTVNIGSNAFYGCENMRSVTIPDSVISIGDCALACSWLTSITIPDSVTSIGNSVFSSCSWLTSVTIPDSIISISDRTFASCWYLTSVTIPDSVTSIGNSAFSGCKSLTSVTIPDSVTSIGDKAFYGCSSSALILTVGKDSYAKQYAEAYGFKYIYPDSYDWLLS